MEGKKIATAGLLAAAAGAGAWFLFSKKMQPTRQKLVNKVRKKTQAMNQMVDAASRAAA